MAYARLAALVSALLGFVVIGIPLQALALKMRWRLAKSFPSFFHRTMCRILRVRVRVTGRPTDAIPQLVVANHVSWVDIVAIGSLHPMCFLAKKEVRKWPVFGTFAVLQRSLFVDRGRVRELPRVNSELAARMSAGDRMVLFAEATTGDGSRLLRFRASHLGAAEALLETSSGISAVALQPLAISYSSRNASPGVAWFGDMDLLPHIWALLRGGPYDCGIGFGTPVCFDRDSDRRTAMMVVERSVADMLDAFARAPEAREGRVFIPSLVR